MRPPLAPGRGSRCVTFFSQLLLGAPAWALGTCSGWGELSEALQKRGLWCVWGS